MVVLQINAVYRRASTGRTTKELHEFLLEHGIVSYIAAPDLAGLSERCYKIGNSLDYKLHAMLSRVTGFQGYFSAVSTYHLIQYIKKIKPDIVHLRNLHSNFINIPMLLSFLAKNGVPVVLTLHDSWFYTGKCVYYIEDGCEKYKTGCGGCPALKKGNTSLFFDQSAKMWKSKKVLFSRIERLAVIGVSKWVAEDAKKSFLGDALIVKTIYNWIDLETFSPKSKAEVREKNALPLNKRIILGVAANWVEAKGIRVFFDIAKLLPEEYLIVLVGKQTAAMYSHDRIMYTGNVEDTQKLAEYYSAADVFLNPSIQETFGKTTAEAMACGIPVVAFASTATPELLGEDGLCGELIKTNSAAHYYEAVINVLEKGPEYYQKNCRSRAVQLFDRTTNSDEYIKVYQDLLNS